MTDDTYRNSTVEPIKGTSVNFNTWLYTGVKHRCLASLMAAKFWLEKDSTAYTKSVVERCLDAAIRELKRHSD